MDLEELNKTQIVLLTLLVSFVSAIATSIFTVKILEQAPPAVTQTINRVVERTVERVVPAEPGELGIQEPTVIEKETTVVVKEDDLITESIDTNKATLARLVMMETPIASTSTDPLATTTEELALQSSFVGMGIFVRNDGLVAAPASFIDAENLKVVTHDGTTHDIEVVGVDEQTDIGFVQLLDVETASFKPATFADPNSLKLGQTVISLSGESRTNVSLGIVSSLIDQTVADETVIGIVATNIANVVPGEPLINIFGELVGIDLSGDGSGLYISSVMLERGIENLAPVTAEAETENQVTQEEIL